MVTGIATGSDQAPGSTQPLSALGMVGEHIVDARVWITRTTYPIRKCQVNDSFTNFQCNKILAMVRNPADVLHAKLHAQVSGTRTKQAEINFRQHSTFISEFVEAAVQEAHAIYDEGFRQFKDRHAPIFFVRYEELVAEPQKTLEDVFKFLLDSKDVGNTVVQRRIKEVVEMGAAATQIYPLDANPAKPSLDHFTDKQQNVIFSKLYDAMEFCGYLR